MHRPERQGSKLEISGTRHSLPYYAGWADKNHSHKFTKFLVRNKVWVLYISGSKFLLLLVVLSTTNLQPNTDVDAKKKLPAKPAGR